MPIAARCGGPQSPATLGPEAGLANRDRLRESQVGARRTRVPAAAPRRVAGRDNRPPTTTARGEEPARPPPPEPGRAGSQRHRPPCFFPCPTSTSVPTIARTICWQNEVASISKRSSPSPRSSHPAEWTVRTRLRSGTLRQNEAKSCSPMNGSQAKRIPARSSGAAMCQVVAARNGSATGRFSTL